jgi:hypothetical protein
MPRISRPDDDAVRFDAVFLGPDGHTLPIQARYVAWGLWAALWFVFSLLLIALPLVGTGSGISWGFAFAIVATKLAMVAVDSDRPLAALPSLLLTAARSVTRAEPVQEFRCPTGHVRIRSLALPDDDPEFP